MEALQELFKTYRNRLLDLAGDYGLRGALVLVGIFFVLFAAVSKH